MKIFVLFFAFLSIANAFAPASLSGTMGQSSATRMTTDLRAHQSDRASGFVAGIVLAASILSWNVQPASAVPRGVVPGDSSIELAFFKTMDMSMPSYGEISDPTAGTDTADSLTLQGAGTFEADYSPGAGKASIFSPEARAARIAESQMSPNQKRAAAVAAGQDIQPAETTKPKKEPKTIYQF